MDLEGVIAAYKKTGLTALYEFRQPKNCEP
jgi:hypothetical protein